MTINTKIYSSENSFDIGIPVISFKEPNGLDFSTAKKGWQWRSLSHAKLKESYKQAVVHWTVSGLAKPTFDSMKSIGVSCHFLIDDDINDHGVATIYQTLDIQHVAFCQGKHTNGVSLNPLGISTEICYFPQYYENKTLYTESTVKKLGGTTDHPVVKAPVHGSTLSVHTPSEAQYKALCSLLWGINNLFPDIQAKFPQKNNKRITTVVDDPLNYNGFCSHYHLTRRKIDCCSLNEEFIENSVSEMNNVGYNIYRKII